MANSAYVCDNSQCPKYGHVVFQGGRCSSCGQPLSRTNGWAFGALFVALTLLVGLILGFGGQTARAQDNNEPTIDAPAVFYADEDVSVTFHVPSEATAAYLAVSSQIDEYPASCTLVAHGSGVNCNGNGVFTLSFHVQFDAQEVWLFNRAFFPGNQQKQVELYVPVEDTPTPSPTQTPTPTPTPTVTPTLWHEYLPLIKGGGEISIPLPPTATPTPSPTPTFVLGATDTPLPKPKEAETPTPTITPTPTPFG